jgi:hypothetical protein
MHLVLRHSLLATVALCALAVGCGKKDAPVGTPAAGDPAAQAAVPAPAPPAEVKVDHLAEATKALPAAKTVDDLKVALHHGILGVVGLKVAEGDPCSFTPDQGQSVLYDLLRALKSPTAAIAPDDAGKAAAKTALAAELAFALQQDSTALQAWVLSNACQELTADAANVPAVEKALRTGKVRGVSSRAWDCLFGNTAAARLEDTDKPGVVRAFGLWKEIVDDPAQEYILTSTSALRLFQTMDGFADAFADLVIAVDTPVNVKRALVSTLGTAKAKAQLERIQTAPGPRAAAPADDAAIQQSLKDAISFAGQ